MYTICTQYVYYLSVLRILSGFGKDIIVLILLAILYGLVYYYRVDMLILTLGGVDNEKLLSK